MRIIPRAEPFFFPGNSTGCLLIHGFTGTPMEMRPLGEYLAQQGYSVLGPRLFGHATSPEDMIRARWQDWAASVEDGWHMLEASTKRIFVIGLSMGGILSLYVSRYLPVAGTVAMSTPYEIPPDPRLRFINLLWRVYPFAAKGEPDWHNPELEEEHISYPKYPTRSIIELQALLGEMHAALPELIRPVLLMHSRQDGDIPPENMAKIYDQVASQEKEKVLVENSGHVITRDLEKELVFSTVDEFIQKYR